MKKLVYIAFALFFVVSCQKEDTIDYPDIQLETRSQNQVTLCHITGNGSFVQIEVNENAVSAHINHGDGYPEACYAEGSYMDENCVLVDVSDVPEDCGNGIDDNCDGLVDEADSATCGCPCYTYEEVKNAGGRDVFYDYRTQTQCSEVGPFVGFWRFSSPCNIGASVEFGFAISPDCIPCQGLTEIESRACQLIIERIQAEENLPPLCGGDGESQEDNRQIHGLFHE